MRDPRSDEERFAHQGRATSMAVRFMRRCPGLGIGAAHRAAERCLAAGLDLLAWRLDADYYPDVCPGCYAVNKPCEPGCIDAAIEENRERERLADREDCAYCGSGAAEFCDCGRDPDDEGPADSDARELVL